MRRGRFKIRRIKNQSRSRKTDFKKLFKKGLMFVFSFLILVILGLVFVFIYFARDLPSPEKINIRDVVESTKIYDRTGQIVLYEIHGEIKRTVIPLDQISDLVKKATLAAEDKDFYRHKGFDLRGILRAILANLGILKRGDTIHGGSTITQQFVKNSILTPEKTFARKIRELILSIEIERKFSKDEILQMYLNEIPYGSNAYGIEAAAQTFFGKSAKNLSLAEAALLAALPKAPTYYSPYGNHPEKLKARQEWVLDRMVECNFITQQEAEQAKKEKLEFRQPVVNIIAPHFVMYIKEQLVERYGEKMVETGGLKVYTTLDTNLQKIAEEVISEGVAKNEKKYKAFNAALVALDPKTGQILAMQGSRDYFALEHDGNVNVAIRERQPGSSFKPFAYAKAFSKGFTPQTIVYDLKTDFGGYIPENYDGRTRGPVTLKQALACSLNIPSVKVLYLAGIDETIDLAQKMGITTLKDRHRYGLALVLGGGEVKLLDMVSAFGVFAQEGIKKPVTGILKIEDKNGKILEEWKDSKGEQVLDFNVARMINDILSDNTARAPVFGSRSPLYLGERPVAAKTGTTQEYRDGWTIGYTPSLVVGVWAGNNDNSPMKWGADGVYVAAPIWKAFMQKALAGKDIEYFVKPTPPRVNKPILLGKEEETKIRICKSSGKLASDLCPGHLVEEKTFKEAHCILHYVDKNNPLGPYPKHPEKDPQYLRWEEPVREWAKAQGLLQEKPPTDKCHLHTKENQPQVVITSPQNQETISDYLKISASVSAPLGVSKVEFWLNDLLVYTDLTFPYEIQFIPEIKQGRAVILVKAYDKAENVGQTLVEVSLAIQEHREILALLSPQPGFNLALENFPYPLLVALSNAQQFEKVEFYFQDSFSQTPQLIDQIKISSRSASSLKLSVLWSYPGPGSYQVYAQAQDKMGNIYFSERVQIIIK